MQTSKWTHCVQGVPMPILPWIPEKNIKDAIDYIPHDGDVIICSYPKTGTSWLQYIVQQIMSKGQPLPKFMDLNYKIIPFIEMAGIDAIEALSKPRIYKHHFPQNIIPIRDNAKYLYIYRNPEDVLISYFHYIANVMAEEYTIDEFIDDFLNGAVPYGNYCNHVMSYLSRGRRENVFVCTYENLISNRKEEVLRLAKFLGEEHYESLKNDEATLDRIVAQTEFDYMKKNVEMMLPGKVSGRPKELESSWGSEREVNYFRKGTVGDGRKSLTEIQLKKIREHVSAKTKGTQLAEEWFSSK